jgi:hypothetical protein
MVIQRELDGELLSRSATPEGQRPRAIAGNSVTSALLLGHLEVRHLEAGSRIPVIAFAGELVPEIVPWTVAWEPDGTHKVGSRQTGNMIIEFRPSGGIEAWLRGVGGVQLVVVPVAEDDYGRGGWPLPPGKLAAAAEDAPEPAEASAPEESGEGAAAEETAEDPPEAAPGGGGA